MTLTELKYVIAVARERHFGRAAESCFVSQPSLSVAVKKLEDELGVSIFERRSTDVAITPIGEKIIAQAQKVLEETRLISEIAKSGLDPLKGSFRLGAIFTIAPYLLPELICRINAGAPSLRLYLEESFTSELIAKLKNGQLDAAITADTIGEDTGLAFEPIYEEQFVVAVPAHHSWVNRNYIGPDELKDQTMLLLGSGHCFRDQILGICPEISRHNAKASDIQRTVEGSSLQTICHMVSQGLGITVLPASAIPYLQGVSSNIKTIPFKSPTPSRKVLLVWRKSFPRMGAIEALKEAMRQVTLSGCFPIESGGAEDAKPKAKSL